MIAIDIDRGAHVVEKFAVSELRKYIKCVLGPNTLSDRKPNGEEKLAICLGAAARRRMRSQALRRKLERLGPEGFVLARAGNDLLITGDGAATGGGEVGTLHGAHSFIERYLGVRWYFIDETIWRRKPVRTFLASIPRDLRVIEAPAFSCRRLAARKIRLNKSWLDYASRNRMDTISVDYSSPRSSSWSDIRRWVPQLRRRGLKLSVSQHSYMQFLPAKRYFRDHPEWFALIDGQRSDVQRQTFCTSSKQALSVFLGNLRQYVKAVPEVDRFDLFPEDGCKWCECARCRRISEPDHHAILANQMAKTVWSVYPDKPFSILAYSTCRAAPKPGLLDPAIEIMFCWWGRDYSLPFNHKNCAIHYDREYNDAGHPACCIQQRDFGDWLKRYGKTNSMVVFEQHLCQSIRGPNLLPVPVLDRDYRWFQSIGLSGIVHQYFGTTPTWTSALNCYVSVRKLWNPRENVRKLIKEFFELCYENAAEPIQRLYERIDHGFPHMRRTYRATERRARNFNLYSTWSQKPQRRYPSGLKAYNENALRALNACDGMLKEARRQRVSSEVRRRLNLLDDYLAYLRGTRQSIKAQIDAVDELLAAVHLDVAGAAAALKRAAKYYEEVHYIERDLAKLVRGHRGPGIFWDACFWTRRKWHGKPKVIHFPRGIIDFTQPDGSRLTNDQ